MQTSRVNGLTSGVFAFLVPASCLNQKGSDTRRDNTTFPVTDYYLHFPLFTTETPANKYAFYLHQFLIRYRRFPPVNSLFV
ncbi:hypothetical protein FML96_23635 [Escherichia coli]|nr:hypothetical protein MS6198_B143 [Escherichia coli]RUL51663.1 hypothetical protein ELP95_19240 [Shigella sonnei]ARW95169.1 hypothetical protein AM366_27165 [Escherichia coli]ARZ90993.1 hypothetical protein AM397_24970 [Escherichia coli]ASY91375.1 hypothetical protein [Escherichia coli]